jgi:hypothetical protein
LIGSIDNIIIIPKRTYISVPMQIRNAGLEVVFRNKEWYGAYELAGSNIWDGAVRWTEGMYKDGLHVVSFQYKKRIPIGKGGMILTDDGYAYGALKLMRYDGRDMSLPYDHPDHIKMLGYHMYMTPEDAARGLLLMDKVPRVNADSGNHTMYTDVSKIFDKL